MLALVSLVPSRIAQKHRNLGISQGVLNAGEERHTEAAVEIIGQQADGEGAATAQTVGEVVGAIVEMLGGDQDPLARFHPKLALTTERLRYRADRHASRLSDVVDCRGAPVWFGAALAFALYSLHEVEPLDEDLVQ